MEKSVVEGCEDVGYTKRMLLGGRARWCWVPLLSWVAVASNCEVSRIQPIQNGKLRLRSEEGEEHTNFLIRF
jgi:hypothetical protein